MATVIRLARFGKRHNPIYRAIVIDNRKARDDSFIESVSTRKRFSSGSPSVLSRLTPSATS